MIQGSGFVSNFLALQAKAGIWHVLSRRMFEQSEFTARWHFATQSLESEPSRGFLVPFVPTKGTYFFRCVDTPGKPGGISVSLNRCLDGLRPRHDGKRMSPLENVSSRPGVSFIDALTPCCRKVRHDVLVMSPLRAERGQGVCFPSPHEMKHRVKGLGLWKIFLAKITYFKYTFLEVQRWALVSQKHLSRNRFLVRGVDDISAARYRISLTVQLQFWAPRLFWNSRLAVCFN